MTWEETIKYIRTKEEYKLLVEFAYFEEELALNVERFIKSEEFEETKKLISKFIKLDSSVKLLDIGSGNGISAIAFALQGIKVDAVEPDPSNTIGAGAIQILKEQYNLHNISVHQGFAEQLIFPDNTFDIVYARQCMHHAHNLQQFLKECSRVLKKNGLLVTVRDHVIYNEKDKHWFLESHPLQKFYGGENAFTVSEYRSAIMGAELHIQSELKHFESVINFFPLTTEEKNRKTKEHELFVDTLIHKKIGIFKRIKFIHDCALRFIRSKVHPPYDETSIPGRMYSFLAVKK